jgi:V/A-type H+-transporting ATPase subunit F
MYKIAAIGESESIFVLQAVGFDVFQVKPEDAAQTLREKFDSTHYAIIFISELLAQELSDLVYDLSLRPFPVVTVLPTVRERMNIGLDQLRKVSIKATGTDLISKMK